jgi:uncharacterized membrane protein required for colicin V production
MEIISRINWVDVLVVILMIRMSYIASREGLSHEIFPFIGSIVMAVVSLHYYKVLGAFISQGLSGIPVELSNFFSFLILVAAMGFLVRFLKGVLDKIVNVKWHPLIEKFGGLTVGVARAYIITSIVLIFLILMPLPYLQWSVRDRSLTGKRVLMAGPEIYGKLSALLPDIKVRGELLNKGVILKDLLSDKSIVAEKKAPADKPSR